jgi:hypothetical protein
MAVDKRLAVWAMRAVAAKMPASSEHRTNRDILDMIGSVAAVA